MSYNGRQVDNGEYDHFSIAKRNRQPADVRSGACDTAHQRL